MGLGHLEQDSQRETLLADGIPAVETVLNALGDVEKHSILLNPTSVSGLETWIARNSPIEPVPVLTDPIRRSA